MSSYDDVVASVADGASGDPLLVSQHDVAEHEPYSYGDPNEPVEDLRYDPVDDPAAAIDPADLAFVRDLRAAAADLEVQQQHERIEALIEHELDPLDPEYGPKFAQFQAMLARGEIVMREDGRWAVGAQEGGERDWTPVERRQVEADVAEARQESQAAAASELDSILGDVAARVGVDAEALQDRASALLEPVRRETGLSGRDLVMRAVVEAAADLAPPADDYDTALARTQRQIRAGRPPVPGTKAARAAARTDAPAARSAPPDTEDYDEVLRQVGAAR